MAMVTIDSGVAAGHKSFGERVLDWMVRVGEMSPGARAARKFAVLNELSDADLAARGLERADLFDHCFGFVRRG